MAKEWFSAWFDSEYYHQLYTHRNDDEAQLFIENLVNYLGLQPNDKVLDLACGKGRHSKMLAAHQLDVTGLDLSENSIAYAKQFETNNLHFAVHDMRRLFCSNYFDIACNLFTSFGYFKHIHQNELVAQTMMMSVKKGGRIIIDFLNSHKSKMAIAEQSSFEKTSNNIVFKINKKVVEDIFIKEIAVHDADKPIQYFIESVQALELQDFIHIFEKQNCKLVAHFGDYQLQSFDKETSNRLIMVFEK